MVQHRFEWLRAATVASLVIAAAACGEDSTGPGSDDPFDPVQSNDEFSAFETAMAGNADLVAELDFVSAALDSIAPIGPSIVAPLDVRAEPALLERIRTTRLSVAAGGVAGSAQPILPAEVLGKTYVWDDVENDYVQSALPGAPANGVRFLLYDRTATPFVENGFVDLTDDSDPSADRVGVHLEKDGLTRLDYDVEVAQPTASSVNVNIAGYVTDGVQRVDFAVLETVTELAGGGLALGLEYDLSLAGQPLSIQLDYQFQLDTTITADLTATFVNGANTLVLDLAQNGQTAAGTVEWNGDLVMTIEADEAGQPVFLGPDGEALTQEEAAAISEMFEAASEGLFVLLTDLLFLTLSVG